MKTKIININGKPYLKIELIKVQQKEKYWFLGKMTAQYLIETYIVRPAKYDIKTHTQLAKKFNDDSEYYNHLITIDEENLKKKDFQREASKERLGQIKKFIEGQEYAFFPNTIIATCELVNDLNDVDIDENSTLADFEKVNVDIDHLSFYYYENDTPYIIVPKESDSILVIDGQHRLNGLKEVDDKIKENYELLIAFIIDVDRSVIAKQFYTINYEQKPVNKSLLYQLTGEFSQDINELTFLHNLVKILNELDKSPFHNRIKMLGVNPPGSTPEIKQKLSVSQAFLIDWLMKTISKGSINSMYSPIFLFYYNRKDKHIEIIRFIIRFFNAVRNLKNDWDKPSESLLSKGMGVGALIRIMPLLFVKIFVEEYDLDPEKIIKIEESIIQDKLEGIQNVDFGKNGPFGRTGSAGSINKIKESLIENIEYFSCNNYTEFEEEYKKSGGCLEKYKKWLIANVKDKD